MRTFIKIKKLLLLLIILLLTLNIFCMNSFAETSLPSVYSPACILIDADSGKILYSKNANTKMYPASTTKIMTAILTLENCKLDDVAIASHNAVYSIPYGYSVATIQEGEELTIEQLLNVLLIPSANDAAVVLAEHIAGSVEAFSDMMNSKAVELGCKNTHFVNPNGIHDEEHYSTAYDLALIGKYAMQFDTFRTIVQKTSYSLPKTNKYDKEDRLFNTTNDLIKKNYSSSPTNYYYQYATGAKTGYTDAAKSCIVATATKDDICCSSLGEYRTLTQCRMLCSPFCAAATTACFSAIICSCENLSFIRSWSISSTLSDVLSCFAVLALSRASFLRSIAITSFSISNSADFAAFCTTLLKSIISLAFLIRSRALTSTSAYRSILP